jgi:hypothetical protein
MGNHALFYWQVTMTTHEEQISEEDTQTGESADGIADGQSHVSDSQTDTKASRDTIRTNARSIGAMRWHLQRCRPNTIDPDLKRDLTRGWLLPYLLELDEWADGRWAYWCRTEEAGKLLDEPIPQVSWCYDPHSAAPARKHLESCLDLIPNHGHDSWLGWSSWDSFDYFLSWLLYGFGSPLQPELPREVNQGCSMRLYQHFNLAWPLAYPYDQFGDLMAECKMGRSAGFFPTPHGICSMMTRMLWFSDSDKDYRAESCMEPALGTGRMLLHASDYCMALYGQDISMTCVKAAICNAYFYAPWMAKPLSFLNKKRASAEEMVSEALLERSIASVGTQLARTDHATAAAATTSTEDIRMLRGQAFDEISDANEQLQLFEIDGKPIPIRRISKARGVSRKLEGQTRLFE